MHTPSNPNIQHVSLSTSTPCTISHIRAYFQNLSLPETNTLCIPPPSAFSLNSTDPGSPFYEPSLGGAISKTATFDDATREAMKNLQRVLVEEGASFGGVSGGRRIEAMLEGGEGAFDAL